MIAAGLDLSLTSTGIAIAYDGRIRELHNLKSKGKKDDTWDMRQERLYGIANSVVEHLGVVDLVVIEGPSYGSMHGSQHDRSGLWWIVVNSLRQDGIPVAVVSPQGRAKYATGSGRAKKDVVMAHVLETYSDVCVDRIANDDLADATVLAAMGQRYLGYPVDHYDPADRNLEAMEGVLWPSVKHPSG